MLVLFEGDRLARAISLISFALTILARSITNEALLKIIQFEESALTRRVRSLKLNKFPSIIYVYYKFPATWWLETKNDFWVNQLIRLNVSNK